LVWQPFRPVLKSLSNSSLGHAVNWNGKPLADRAALDAMLLEVKAQEPQPELHIKAQGKAKYEAVAGVLASAQRQGLTKIGIVGTEQFAAP